MNQNDQNYFGLIAPVCRCGGAPSPARFGHTNAWWSGVFSGNELIKLVETLDALPQAPAQVVGESQGPALEKIRRAQLAWVPVNDDTRWFLEKVSDTIKRVNAEYFGFDLSGFLSLQYTVYNAENGGGHYDWHVDMLGKGEIQRKLSFTLNLSDPMSCEGGELWLWTHMKCVMTKDLGTFNFFPSHALHRVTPVTKGVRKSLVGWVVGPDWK